MKPVTREELYRQVWVEPVLKAAERYGVSGSFLARVCTDLNVPRPERGHWAKLAAGKKVKQPPLPPTRPGDYVSWAPGVGLYRPELPIHAPDPATIRTTRKRQHRPAQHDLLAGKSAAFKKSWKESLTGHLRPMSGYLPDITVSEKQLDAALALANELFLSLEDRGHHVAYGTGQRPEPFERTDRPNTLGGADNWRPNSPTVAFIGTVGIGLSIFESTELLDARYSFEHSRYLRVSSPELRKNPWRDQTRPNKHPFPTGLFAVRAFSVYPDTDWQQQWIENAPGQLVRKVPSIIKEIEAAAPTIVPMIEAAREQHEREKRKWEADLRRSRREEMVRRQNQASEASLKDLGAIIESWAEARNIEGFFADLEQRAQILGPAQREQIVARASAARELLGGTDALARFSEWRSPLDRLGPDFRVPPEQETPE